MSKGPRRSPTRRGGYLFRPGRRGNLTSLAEVAEEVGRDSLRAWLAQRNVGSVAVVTDEAGYDSLRAWLAQRDVGSVAVVTDEAGYDSLGPDWGNETSDRSR